MTIYDLLVSVTVLADHIYDLLVSVTVLADHIYDLLVSVTVLADDDVCLFLGEGAIGKTGSHCGGREIQLPRHKYP